ncbi:hypothetical protein E2C01_075737 [Portunus trituberculatus]|uniref:Uncharacterized protein n=1 Tax=Portunus trituberculatus TaxID=210409 RepID=A0A5B7IGJ6_PORTR|nr:hypothetical protein [Portunus trituberculatus]
MQVRALQACGGAATGDTSLPSAITRLEPARSSTAQGSTRASHQTCCCNRHHAETREANLRILRGPECLRDCRAGMH